MKGEGESQRLRGKPTQKRTTASRANRSERRMLAVLSWVIATSSRGVRARSGDGRQGPRERDVHPFRSGPVSTIRTGRPRKKTPLMRSTTSRSYQGAFGFIAISACRTTTLCFRISMRPRQSSHAATLLERKKKSAVATNIIKPKSKATFRLPPCSRGLKQKPITNNQTDPSDDPRPVAGLCCHLLQMVRSASLSTSWVGAVITTPFRTATNARLIGLIQ